MTKYFKNTSLIILFNLGVNIFYAQTVYQNFIRGGSFDTLISADCQTYGYYNQHDNYWYEYPTIAGFLNSSCSISDIPNSYVGYQFPYKGSGMYYLSTIGNVSLGCWEGQSYVGAKLRKKLKTNKQYRGRFYANLCDSCDFATSRLGMFVSSFKPNPIYLQPNFPNSFNPYINAIPQVQKPYGMAITDKVNWTLVEGTFKASLDMTYMTIGNFYRANQTDTFRVSNTPEPLNNLCFNDAAAYFIDEVSLVEEDRAEAYMDTSKNYLCVKQGTTKVLGDTAERPWLQYVWRDKNNSIVGSNRNYTYNAAFIENTFFTVEIKDTGEYAFITKAIDTIFLYTSVSPDTVNCEPVGLQEVLKDAEEIELYYAENSIKFNTIHERFTGSEIVLKSIDGKVIYKSKLERKKNEYLINTELQKGFYFVEVIYENNSIRRKKIVVQ
jgi:hypothetical protein